VTGQDAEVPSVKSIIAKEQTQTVFKDTRTLAKRAADMVDSVLTGKAAEINDTKTYNNGKLIVPSYLCDPVNVDIANIKEALVDTGYYTNDQIGLK
jgi:putative multiple sugar transport system substrate-binding protein